MFDKMKQLMELKKQADQLKRELDQEQIECADVQGVKVKINGSQHFLSIELDESKYGLANKAQLQADLVKGLNAAVKKSQVAAAQKMKNVMPGFPGM